MANRMTNEFEGIRFIRNVENNPEDLKFQK